MMSLMMIMVTTLIVIVITMMIMLVERMKIKVFVCDDKNYTGEDGFHIDNDNIETRMHVLS